MVTQDCDLEQDFKVRFPTQLSSDKLVPNILLSNVDTAAALRGTPQSTGINSAIWKRINQNKDERYHFLQAVDKSCDGCGTGLPEMGIDFKRYFTMPTDELYRRIEVGEAQRRCVLVSPYLEHFISRFMYYLSRVALPEDHFSEPEGKHLLPS